NMPRTCAARSDDAASGARAAGRVPAAASVRGDADIGSPVGGGTEIDRGRKIHLHRYGVHRGRLGEVVGRIEEVVYGAQFLADEREFAVKVAVVAGVVADAAGVVHVVEMVGGEDLDGQTGGGADDGRQVEVAGARAGGGHAAAADRSGRRLDA